MFQEFEFLYSLTVWLLSNKFSESHTFSYIGLGAAFCGLYFLSDVLQAEMMSSSEAKDRQAYFLS